jgi:hypothetical protein
MGVGYDERMWLRYKGVRDNKTFARTGDTMLLVDFTDGRTNVPAGDWCPGWDEVERIVVAALSVEKVNRGRMVKAVERINELAATRLPEQSIRRFSAVITSYKKPTLHVLNLDADRSAEERYTLSTPLSQDMLDLIVENRIQCVLILRDGAVIKILLHVEGGSGRTEEVSAGELSPAEVKIQRLSPDFVRITRG